jgi:hypothetical protein
MKKVWKSAITIIFGAYVVSVTMVFTPYYNWQYAKSFGVVKWVLFGEVIATAKAVVWPYFVFGQTGGTVSHFINAVNYENKATAIINRGGSNQQISQAEMEEIVGYYKQALTEAKKADIESMNQHYSGFGDHFKSEFREGLELFIKSHESGDVVASLHSQELLDKWGNWYQANIDNIKGSSVNAKQTNEPNISDNVERHSIDSFFTGYTYFISANQLAKAMVNPESILKDFENVKTLLNKSRERLKECDKNVLNKIYSEWGNKVYDKFIPALDLTIAGIQPRGDRNDPIRGDALLADFDTWLQKNKSDLSLRLNEEFGYEIK